MSIEELKSISAVVNDDPTGSSVIGHPLLKKIIDLAIRQAEALMEIAKYGENDHYPGCCPYGCDCPEIARCALEEDHE